MATAVEVEELIPASMAWLGGGALSWAILIPPAGPMTYLCVGQPEMLQLPTS